MSEQTTGSSLGAGIEECATDFLRRYWNRQLPIDPVQIATAAGLEVYGRGGAAEEGYAYSGYYRRLNGRPSIEYNVGDPLVRQRFTVAHELGHHALGHEDAPRDAGSFHSSGDPREREANRFAAALIMPAGLVRHHYFGGTAPSLDGLARIFGVSRDAMGYRLIHLRLG